MNRSQEKSSPARGPLRAVRHTESVPDALRTLLEGYPSKRFQTRFLGLSRLGMARYQFEAFRKSDLRATPFVTFWEGQEPAACFGLSRNGWHSEHFGVEFYRLVHLLFSRPDANLCKAVMERVLSEAEGQGVDVIGVRVDGEELLLQQHLVRSGFFLTGHSVKMALPTEQLDITPLKDYASNDCGGTAGTLRDYRDSDLEPLKHIARASHWCSHFFNDRALVERGADALFPAWLEKCCRGLAAKVLVAEDGEGSTTGFVTLLLNERLAESSGRRPGVIDFVAVAPEAQGQGWGKRLVAAALEWLRPRTDYIEIRTELTNFPAIRLYGSFGFQLVSADVNFHRWMSGKTRA